MRDFFEILESLDIYREANHNKSENTYTLNGNTFEFISLDQPQKIRGRKRKYLFCNEANELTWEDFFQLIIRTTGRVWLDFNPSDSFHWIYERLLPREDCTLIKSTYKDNPFLDATIIEELERLKDTDEDYWRVYGLGERGMSRANIFQYHTGEMQGDTIAYGLDFGFTNDPTALVRVDKAGDNLYIKELLYTTGLTNQDISQELTKLGLTRYDEIWADSAEPKSIEELHRLGWNIKPTAKGSDSIMAGIDILKRHKLHITPDSSNVIKEMQNYKWKEDKNGNLLNRPIDQWNHAVDAIRYATFNKLSRPDYGRYAIR